MRPDLFSYIDTDGKESSFSISLLQTVLDTIPVSIQIYQAVRDKNDDIVDFTLLLANKANGVNIKHDGNSDGTIIGSSFLSNYADYDKKDFVERLTHTLETGEPGIEVIQLKTDQHDKWFEVKYQKLGDNFVMTSVDITEFKKAEEKIKELNETFFVKNHALASLNSEMKTFNSIAANDYKDTLHNLYTAMEFIISHEANKLSDVGKANVRRSQASIQKMRLLTEDIIAYSNIHTLENILSVVDLNNVVAGAIADLKHKIEEANAGIQAEELPKIKGYPLLLSLLFHHLLDNAIKFRKDGGHHTVKIRHNVVRGDKIENLDILKDISYHVITIEDNGIGFEKDHMDGIFEIFYRAHQKGKYKGSGIGLAISRKVMNLHGGFITTECDPNCTTFNCYFPIIKDQ